MKSIPISFDEDIFDEIERAASAANLSFSDIVGDAVRRWLKRQHVQRTGCAHRRLLSAPFTE